MFLTELFENQQSKHAAFCFGRMNPPTVGHAQLINTVAKASQGGDYFVFVSQTQDSKKNPLDYKTKVQFIKAMFPNQAGHVVYAPELKTIIDVAKWLYNKGYRSVTFAAGSDRLDSFKKLLTDYNGKDDYNFSSINFVSSGDRDPDAEGIAGVSASAAREAAKANDIKAFTQATGAGKLAPQLFQAVRKGMLLEGLSEGFTNDMSSKDMLAYLRQHHDKNLHQDYINHINTFSKFTLKDIPVSSIKTDLAGLDKSKVEQYKQMDFSKAPPIVMGDGYILDGYHRATVAKALGIPTIKGYVGIKGQAVAEDASGYIPKNKKEAKDPRWSNALTVDVTPKTPMKNLKAFKLA